MLGGLFGLLAAATFAFNNAAARRGVLTGSVAQAIAITVPIGVPMFFIAALAAGALPLLAAFSATSLLYLATAGIIHFVWGRYCNYRATKAMGANLVGPVQQVSLILTLGLAIVVLGEVLTPLRVIGILLVVLGPMLTLPGKSEQPAKSAAPASEHTQTKPAVPAFKANYAEGYLWSLLSAIGYGSSPILVTLGIGGKGLTGSLAAGVVAYSAATIVTAVILLWPGQIRHVFAIRRDAAAWFTLSGVLVCLSQMFLYMGYAVAPVSVVSPIQRLSIVFRVYASRLINPHHEVFGGKVIAGTFVSLIGAVALTVSTDVVLTYVPLPDVIVEIVRWRWP